MRLTVVVLVCIGLSVFPLQCYGEGFIATVVGVIDGDSIRVLHNHQPEQIRLSGIDCPERKQAFGTKAKHATSMLAIGKHVTVQTVTKDRYKRTVATVTLPDGVQLNEELVRQGMCWWYRKYAPHNGRLQELEAVARSESRGLWVDKAPLPPWEFRSK